MHTAAGISIRFPRVTRIRTDKDWQTATDLPRLQKLMSTSQENADQVGNYRPLGHRTARVFTAGQSSVIIRIKKGLIGILKA